MTTQVSTDLPHLPDLPPIKDLPLRVARPIAKLIMRSLWRIQVHGAEQVPASGPVILAANHIGFLDGPVLVAVTRRLSFVLAKRELFRGTMGRFLGRIGQIPVDRHGVDKEAISRSIQVLRSERVMVVFPEGIRGAGEVTFAKGGAAYLAMVTGAPIVPVALLGTRDPGQTTSEMPHRRARIHVVYGEPLRLPRSAWPRRKPEVAELTEQVRVHLAEHVIAAQALTGLPLPGPPKAKTRKT
ncbi:MAG: 1-acyl-sn-glycerol-3-phosphate acyltransferase [Propionibacteriaceae bacterium]|nr:1-acyl-sn-glycerol-3-phosphate acyltransferase [Propionibacteriaceae bacterium]MDX6321566.1 1-acyl-sn-glycerol-3-phosphate acyltransferase [Propionibacteriaceae bacterium]